MILLPQKHEKLRTTVWCKTTQTTKSRTCQKRAPDRARFGGERGFSTVSLFSIPHWLLPIITWASHEWEAIWKVSSNSNRCSNYGSTTFVVSVVNLRLQTISRWIFTKLAGQILRGKVSRASFQATCLHNILHSAHWVSLGSKPSIQPPADIETGTLHSYSFSHGFRFIHADFTSSRT
jgi:hypothetical protein